MNMNLKNIALFFLAIVAPSSLCAQSRREVNISQWQFSRDSVHWQQVSVPHDWAISGPFDKKWDLQKVAIAQNGETQETEKSGRSGALPWIGKGYYKTKFRLSDNAQHAELLFDGAMSEPVIYVNGHRAGSWAYGYNAFRIDITPYLYKGDNSIEVSLQNLEESSRWYPGGGLYRPVTLILTGKTRFDDWASYVRTERIEPNRAILRCDLKVIGNPKGSSVRLSLKDKDGKEALAQHGLAFSPDSLGRLSQALDVDYPHLWSPEQPYLYALTMVLQNADGKVLDAKTMKVGIRTISVTKEKGFCLNGETRKFKGVCLHHDLGPLGTAVNRDALIRQVKILKDMGCDAIRTSHNMPSTMQMEVYDSLGMMVMGESFDMWKYPKCKNGYCRFFSDWADKDITNLVLNHRNHPSLVMYSIGNEIPEQWSADGVKMARHLQDLCHQLDPTRPVTQGLDQVDNALKSGIAQEMDIPGFNYRVQKYLKGHEVLPQGFLLGSETASTISSRGVYKFPVTLNSTATYPDGQVNSYDMQYCPWSNVPETDFMMQDDYPWVIGQFVWTGFDYLGEPTPYDEYWPSRSSYFGICDLAGLPKDRFYLYRSQWNKTAHTVHLLPHWTWPGREGKVTPVVCYTDGVEGELFINGHSQGRVHKDFSRHAWDIDPDSVNTQPLLDRYRLRWNNVKYEPGELRVVVYDSLGNKIGEDVRHTAGRVAEYRIDSGKEISSFEGSDLVFLTITAVDKKGIEVPDASNELRFTVTDNARFKAVCNGDATSVEVFTRPQMRLFHGKLVVILQRTSSHGAYGLTVTDGHITNRI
ncbi:MAG: DUF4982 domain-containing protein [Prevotella sp.]|jgi:beta-galactosidase|nr:DUF4982 domain-containing protein [Prevotella sp.]